MTLTENQKEFLRKNAKDILDLNELTKKCFGDNELDGRSKEGRAVKKFLADNHINYNTTKRKKAKKVTFTESEKEFILQQAKEGISSLAIAKLLFPKQNVKPLSTEQRSVLEYINSINPDFLPSKDGGALNDYIGPKSPSRIIKKINDATGIELEEGKMNRQTQICIDKLGKNLNNSRFIRIINNYTNSADRELFEQEFIRLTWDKPDLTPDEINLYMNVCKEIINLEVISGNVNKLNDMFEEAEEQSEITVRLAEILKTKSSEYDQCSKRISDLTKKLQGDRGERMKKRQRENASFLSIVQMFQDEEERKNMIRMSELEKIAVKEEAERLEGMGEWKARVLGISIEDVV